jgi:hypothetical protein
MNECVPFLRSIPNAIHTSLIPSISLKRRGRRGAPSVAATNYLERQYPEAKLCQKPIEHAITSTSAKGHKRDFRQVAVLIA